MSTPIPTARRNVAWRIEQLLRAQEALPSPTLTAWQADTVLAAIQALDEGRYADGEIAMMKAERPDLWEPKGYGPAAKVDVARLVELLQQAMP